MNHFGVPSDIVSDRDAKFIGRLWVALFGLLDTKLKFFTANNPHIDGQTKGINVLLEKYLTHYITANQKNWISLLDSTQFCYNLHRSSVTKMSLFELVYG